MPVNVATEYDSALQAYLDNASYEAEASVAKAKLFLTACTKLIALVPQMTGTRESTTQMKVDEYRLQRESCQEWLSTHDTSADSRHPSVTRVSFENFRD